jgi:hypothetical protein
MWLSGLLKWDSNPPLAVTKHRGKGYDLGLVAVLEKAEDVSTYGDHPAHKEYVAFQMLSPSLTPQPGYIHCEKPFVTTLWHTTWNSPHYCDDGLSLCYFNFDMKLIDLQAFPCLLHSQER